MRGSIRIPPNTARFTLTGRAFPSVPRLAVVFVRMPSIAGSVISASVVDGTFSQDGFVVELSGAPSLSGHILDYFVSLKADIEDIWDYYTAGTVEGQTLNNGPGWSGAWSFPFPSVGIEAYEDWESYTAGYVTAGMSAPYGWTGSWSFPVPARGVQSGDDMESYVDGNLVNGLNGGFGFSGAYVDRDNYATSSVINGQLTATIPNVTLSGTGTSTLTGTANVTLPNVTLSSSVHVLIVGSLSQTIANVILSATGRLGPDNTDDFESYADSASVNGLNGGGPGWTAAYVDRSNFYNVVSSDNMESYSDGASVNSLNGGSGWNGAYVDR